VTTIYLRDVAPESVSMVALLESRAAEDAARTFFTWGEERYALGTFDEAVDRMAGNLQAFGISTGTHVAVLMDTSPDYLTLWFALAKLGAVEVPINTAYLGDLLRHQLTTSGATVAVVDAAYASRITAIEADATMLETLVVRGPAEIGAGSLRRHDFSSLLSDGPAFAPSSRPAHHTTAGIIFTSGTTGPSKGVLLSHHYLAAYGYMYAEVNGLASDDVVFNFMPFFHMGAKFLTIATLVCGGMMRLAPRLSISTFADEVRAHGITNFVGVGGICNMLLSKPAREDDAKASIRTVYAVPDPAESHDELEQRFSCRVTTVYGSTEAGLPIWRGVTDAYRAGSCGRASPYYEVRVVDDYDNEVPAGESGQFVVRPKLPFLVGSGYVGMPEQTIRAWRNLWLHTGDRGRVDTDGHFYFEDRATDTLRRRGENISSFEVESLVTQHPAVSEAVAVAAPSGIGEDEVRVLVILREGESMTPEELLQHCSTTMPYFMVPRYIDIVDDLPRTPTAKVEKYKLRAEGLTPATWDREAHGWRVKREGLTREALGEALRPHG